MIAPALVLMVALQAAPAPPVLRFSPRPNRASEIHWRAFGPEAFAEARAAHKPLLLNLAAVWCHWCHVFDETTLSDPRVIALLNARFIPIRVDADQNPQVERRYLLGGWPTNAFLDERGAILGGGTYIPPERFLQAANLVVEGYGGDRAALRAKLGGAGDGTASDAPVPGALEPKLAERIGGEIRGSMDPVHGGFGEGMKFPQGEALSLLAYLSQTRHDAALGKAVQGTLRKMVAGEIFDRVEGGFFRYALQPDWSSPHYEKMLATNAELLEALADAYAVTPDETLRGAALATAGYLVTHLWDEQAGAFFSSQDADEAYYRLDAAGRAKRKAPFIDRTFLADRLALTTRALLRAAVVFQEPDLARYARRTGDFVLARMRAPSGAVFHALAASADAKPTLPGALGDQGSTALALLDLAAYTGDERYLRAAGEIVGAAQRALADPQGPAFFDLPSAQAGAGLTAERVQPFHENVELAWALLRLGLVSGNDALTHKGVATLTAFAGRAKGIPGATFARAAELATGHAVRVIVVGPAASPKTRALREAVVAEGDPRLELRLLEAGPRGAKLGGLSFPVGPPAAYVCAGNACSRPLRDATQLEGQISAFVEAHLP